MLADPVQLNSRLGTYTNFVNLLDLAAIAVPSGMRGDGLPSSLTLIAPAGADGLLAGLAAGVHARSGAPMGATGLTPPPAPQMAGRAPERIEIAVVGAHLSGLPLNGELKALGARFVREVETTADYRLYALPGTKPAKPGLLRVGEGEGAAIKVEIWSLDAAGFGAFVAAIPAAARHRHAGLADGARPRAFWSRRRRCRAPRTSPARRLAGLSGARLAFRTTRPLATAS